MLRRSLSRWSNPWQELDRLQHEVNRLFEGLPARGARYAAPRYPAMNVWINDDGAVLTAELPGCDPDALDISVIGEVLTLSGSRQAEEVPEHATYHRRERACGRFSRTFELPFSVEAEAVEASFENGVLRVILPRAEADKPRKIEIKTA